jgi:hypothetical protein
LGLAEGGTGCTNLQGFGKPCRFQEIEARDLYAAHKPFVQLPGWAAPGVLPLINHTNKKSFIHVFQFYLQIR